MKSFLRHCPSSDEVGSLTTNNQLVVISDFGATPGYESIDGLTLGADGDLYGSTSFGGGGASLGCGTVFNLDSAVEVQPEAG
jgi:uncharacterized repeat protein (TIGR03803 family)